MQKSFINPQLSFEDLTDEKFDLIETYNMYGDMNLDNYVIDRIGNNVFVYDINTNLNEDDYMELQQLKNENDSIFIEKLMERNSVCISGSLFIAKIRFKEIPV